MEYFKIEYFTFWAAGKHPLAGLIAGYAAVNAGFTANVMITATDALLYPVTEATAQMIDPNYTTTVANNWYFMIASCVMLTIVGVFVNNKTIVPSVLVNVPRPNCYIWSPSPRGCGLFLMSPTPTPTPLCPPLPPV